MDKLRHQPDETAESEFDKTSNAQYTSPMPKRKANRDAFTDQIRTALRNSGIRMIDIARETDTEPAVISRFMSGKAGMTLKTLDRIAAMLELQVVAPPVRKPKTKGK